MLGALRDFHTEYIVDGTLYNVVFDRLYDSNRSRRGTSAGMCYPRLHQVLEELQEFLGRRSWRRYGLEDAQDTRFDFVRADGQKLLDEMNADLKSDPVLERMPVCLYKESALKIPYHRRALKVHERFHAYLRKLEHEGKFSPSSVMQAGLETRLMLGLNTFSAGVSKNTRLLFGYKPRPAETQVGVAFYWISRFNGWANEDRGSYLEEVVARLAELEDAYKSRNKNYLNHVKQYLYNAMNTARRARVNDPLAPSYVMKLDFWTTDFIRLYRRIKAKHGSVKQFILSLTDPR